MNQWTKENWIDNTWQEVCPSKLGMKWTDAGRIVTKKGRDMLQESQTEDAESHNVKSSAVYMQHRRLGSKQWHQVCTQAVRDKKRELDWTDKGRISSKEKTEH